MSRAGDPNSHTHVLVQNAAQGPDGRWTALDSDRLYAQLMAADHLYLGLFCCIRGSVRLGRVAVGTGRRAPAWPG
jgi:hypothetical protein